MSLTTKGLEQIDAELLGPLTDAQRACVQCFGRPLVVSAGAGSGKTFMLTRRIAYALAHPELSGVESIDQILAITFTTLAAGEIKARVRSTLRSIGMTEQAALVDSCWISTIHGMCSRILHEHALELGLDPSFGLLDETDADKLRLDAINETIGHASGGGDEDGRAAAAGGGYEELFADYGGAVSGMVERLLSDAANVPGGLDAISCGAAPRSAHDLAREVRDALESANAAARALGIDSKGRQGKSAWATRMLDVTMAETGLPAFERLLAARDLTHEQLAGALDAFYATLKEKGRGPTLSGVRNEEVKEADRTFRFALFDAGLECEFGLAPVARDQLVALAREVQARYEQKKADLCVLDQNDLLTKTLDALEHNRCGVADEYRDRFKMVLVDEFQDTSDLQIAIVSFMDGQGHERLCTVGDAQQSIYRFRGADVNTYLRFKQEVAGIGGELRKLDKNYRSHGDVIQFVNAVFGQERVFGGPGSEFIRLDWDHEHARRNAFETSAPRIDVLMATSRMSTRAAKGASTEDRLALEAAVIAERFRAIHDADPAGGKNRSWGDMVILLGSMTTADVYAQALRGRGIPCVIAGGSIFDRAPEAQQVCCLANALANPRDDEALGQVLAGEPFRLSPEELLLVADTGRGSYWNGVLRLARPGGKAPARVALAAGALTDAVARTGTAAPSELLLDVITASGWLERLRAEGPQGLATAANVLKAVRMAEDFEADPHAPRGMAAVAARMQVKFSAGMKEAPGALNTQGGGAVRIMTIHASKGLEFPVVALGAFYKQRTSRDQLVTETVDGHICLALKAGARAQNHPVFAQMRKDYASKLKSLPPEEVPTPPADPTDECAGAREFFEATKAHAEKGDLEEMRRKFYVGATRPREALVLAMHPYEMGEEGYADDIVEDVRQALAPSTDLESVPGGYEFGGEQRAACTHYRMTGDAETGAPYVLGVDVGDGQTEDVPLEELLDGWLALANPAADDGKPARATVPVPEYVDVRALEPTPLACNPLRAGAFSYSSVAQHDNGAEADPDETPVGKSSPSAGAPDTDEPAVTPRCAGDPTAFGSAFHLAAQLMAESRPDGAGVPELPSDARLRAALRTWGTPQTELPRLRDALARWAGSAVAARAYAHPRAQAEAPLCALLPGPDGEPLHLEGSIDLLCLDPGAAPAGQRAYVVDYKTGGSAAETPEQLRAKHLLQAQCYAYAVLGAGYAGVELRFVRVEQEDAARPGQPQVVSYAFEHGQLQELADAIRQAYARRPGA